MDRELVLKRFKELSRSLELTVIDVKLSVEELDKAYNQINTALLDISSVERGIYIDLPTKMLERDTNSLLNALDNLKAALRRNVSHLLESAAAAVEETTAKNLRCVDDEDLRYLLSKARSQMTTNLDMLVKLEARLKN